MNKNRVEAFSDGVFAIVITLLILDIKLPHDIPYDQLGAALLAVVPKLQSYVLSFFIIGLYWAFHHAYMERLKQVNGTLILLNTVALLVISFMPFPTSLLGEFPNTAIPLVIYGLTLIASNVIGFAILLYLNSHPFLLKDGVHTPQFLRQYYFEYAWVNASYVFAILLAFYMPVASYVIYIAVLLGVSLNLKKNMNYAARTGTVFRSK